MIEIKNIIVLFLLLFIVKGIESQNLVSNSSFEEYTSCPFAYSLLWFAQPWETSDPYNSSDLFNSCGGDCWTCVPQNVFGYQFANTGEGYAGFWCYNHLNRFVPNMTETIQTELNSPMIAGEEYEVSFYVSLGDQSTYAIDQLSVHFSVNEVITGFDISLEPHIQSPEGIYLSDKNDWMLISGIYIAEGGEQWMTFANFDSYLETNETPVSGGIFDGSYYYLDDVTVELASDPPIEIEGETSICLGDSVTLTAINGTQWAWSAPYDPDNIFSTDSIVSVSPEQYTVYYVDSGTDIASIAISVIPLPEIDLGLDQTLCEGEELIIDPGLELGNFIWQDGSIESIYNVEEPGLYTLEYYDGTCSNIDSVNISFNPQIEFSLGFDTTICENSTIELHVPVQYQDYNISWSTDSDDLTQEIQEEGIYILEIDDGVCFGVDDIEIQTINCEVVLEIPNIFTPNGQSVNELFTPIVIENIAHLNTRIFDRWGNLIFQTDDLSINWDGKNLERSNVAEGTYYYIIEYIDLLGVKHHKTGYVMILR